MFKNKDGKVKSQLHLYCNPKLYNDFKNAVKQYNETAKDSTTISEVIRVLMMEFINNSSNNSNFNAEFMEMINNNKGGALWY